MRGHAAAPEYHAGRAALNPRVEPCWRGRDPMRYARERVRPSRLSYLLVAGLSFMVGPK